MNKTEIKEILCKQLELLTEKSKDCTLEELIKIDETIVKIVSTLNYHFLNIEDVSQKIDDVMAAFKSR